MSDFQSTQNDSVHTAPAGKEKEFELLEVIKAANQAGIVTDGGFGKQCTIELFKVLDKKKVESAGIVLESQQIDAVTQAGIWQAIHSIQDVGVQIEVKGLGYVVSGPEATASDLTRFGSSVVEMVPKTAHNSFLYCKDTPNEFGKEMIQMASDIGVEVFTDYKVLMEHLHA